MRSDAHQIKHMDSPEQSWHWYAAASLACHIFLIATVLFFPFSSVSMPDFSDRNVIEVDLAAIQPQTPRPPDPASEAVRRAPPEPEKPVEDAFVPEASAPEPEPEPQKAVIPVKKAPEKQFDPSDYVVEKPGPKIKHSMKKQTIRTAAVHRSAVEKLKEKSDVSRPRSVKDRIDALKSEVAGQDRKLTDRLAAKTKGSGGGSARDMAQIEVYQAEVAVRLKNNWVFSDKLAGQTQGLESRLVIKILPDGSITDVWYEKRSGNSYLDQSAYKTVMKSDPLPPLPQGYPYYHLMVGFTPSGLAR